MFKTKKGILLIFLLAAFQTWVAAKSEPTELIGLDAYIRQSMADWKVPGLAIAVVKDNAVIFMKGYGVREMKKEARVNERTVFALSSNGKAFTAAAVGILVDEGKLSWDDPIVKHLPWFQLPDPWVTREVTLRDMLSHRVASDLGTASGYLWAMTSLSRNEILRRLRYLQSGENRFRSHFEYNNPNILAAGQVVAAVSGMSWDEFMKSRILKPLGMTSATTSVYELWDKENVAPCYECGLSNRKVGIEEAKIENIVMPHIPTKNGPVPIPWRTVDNIAPAGSINLNVEDAAKWLQFQLGKGIYQGKRLLSIEASEEMHSPQMVVPISRSVYSTAPGYGRLAAYGLGWFLHEYRGRKIIIHTGAITGFKSVIAMLPEENIGVAVLSNMHMTPFPLPSFLPTALVMKVFDSYLGAPDIDWSHILLARVEENVEHWFASLKKIETLRVPGTKPSISLPELVGTYSNQAFGELNVREENGKIVLKFRGAHEGELEHWHYDVFRVNWRGPRYPFSFSFVNYGADLTGQIHELRFESMGVFKRTGPISQSPSN